MIPTVLLSLPGGKLNPFYLARPAVLDMSRAFKPVSYRALDPVCPRFPAFLAPRRLSASVGLLFVRRSVANVEELISCYGIYHVGGTSPEQSLAISLAEFREQ